MKIRAVLGGGAVLAAIIVAIYASWPALPAVEKSGGMAPAVLSPLAVPVVQPDAPVVAQAPEPAQAPPSLANTSSPAALHPKDAEFLRLSASTNPVDRARAYLLAYDCARAQRMLATTGVQEHRLSSTACGLAPGHWQDTALRRRLLADHVEQGGFATYSRVTEERPNGPLGAFTGDPEGYKVLLARARVLGIERAEPTALLAEVGELRLNGYLLNEDGQTERAKAAYRQAMVYSIAAQANAERRYCEVGRRSDCQRIALDLNKVPELTAYEKYFSPAERKAIVSEGLKWSDRRGTQS